MTSDRAPLPRPRGTRQARRRPQTWPLTAGRHDAVCAVLVALGYGAAAALIVFGLFLAVAG